jgi:hypothetical protein
MEVKMDDDKWNMKVKDQFMDSVSSLWDETYVTDTFSDTYSSSSA